MTSRSERLSGDPSEVDHFAGARWISRAVEPEYRTLVAMPGARIEWVTAGHSLAQPFESRGPVIGVNLDVVFREGASPVGTIQLVDDSGKVIQESPLAYHGFPPDRFSTFLALERPVPAGRFEVVLTAQSGEIGWREGVQPPTTRGTGPLGLRKAHFRDGRRQSHPLALGVEVPPAPNPEFEKTFDLVSMPARAELRIIGLGYCTVWVNDVRLGTDVLMPAQTQYDKRVGFLVHEVSDLLLEGTNRIRVQTGRGFWSVRGTNVWGWHLAAWTQEPVIRVLLTTPDADLLVSDRTWLTRPSAVQSDLLFTGVTSTIGDVVPDWEPVSEVPGPGGLAVPSDAPPVRAGNLISALTSSPFGADSSAVFDFGRIIAGVAEIHFSGGPGEIRLKYGEYLDHDGHVVCDNILASGEAQVDRLLVKSRQSDQSWRPEFGYKGFRYVEVTTVNVDVDDVRAVPYVSEVDKTGGFSCDEPTLAWLPDATAATLLNNLHGVPTDTPVYEKNGWTADAHLVREAAVFHLDMRQMLAKWLDDHVDAQDVSGVVPQIVPTPGWGRRLDPAWSGSMVLLPWTLYWEYGDSRFLERWLEPARRYVDRTLDVAFAADGIWPLHSWGDWMTPGGSAPEGPAPTSTMMVAELSRTLARMLKELGDDSSARHYERAFEGIRAAYDQAYFDKGVGYYRLDGVGYRQTMNVLPLAFGAVTESRKSGVARSVACDVEERTRGHLDCGAVGSKYLLPVLTDANRLDLAITVATQRTEPAWGIAAAAGDSTLWESFDHSARSRDHYFLGSVSDWVHRSIGGLQQTAVGWTTFDVRLPDDPRVSNASTWHHSTAGKIDVTWLRRSSHWRVDLQIPENTSATITIPGHEPLTLQAGDHHLERAVIGRESPAQ